MRAQGETLVKSLESIELAAIGVWRSGIRIPQPHLGPGRPGRELRSHWISCARSLLGLRPASRRPTTLALARSDLTAAAGVVVRTAHGSIWATWCCYAVLPRCCRCSCCQVAVDMPPGARDSMPPPSSSTSETRVQAALSPLRQALRALQGSDPFSHGQPRPDLRETPAWHGAELEGPLRMDPSGQANPA